MKNMILSSLIFLTHSTAFAEDASTTKKYVPVQAPDSQSYLYASFEIDDSQCSDGGFKLLVNGSEQNYCVGYSSETKNQWREGCLGKKISGGWLGSICLGIKDPVSVKERTVVTVTQKGNAVTKKRDIFTKVGAKKEKLTHTDVTTFEVSEGSIQLTVEINNTSFKVKESLQYNQQ